MYIQAKLGKLNTIKTNAIVVGINQKLEFKETIIKLDKLAKGFFTNQQKLKRLPQETGQIRTFYDIAGISCKTIIVIAYQDNAKGLYEANKKIQSYQKEHNIKNITNTLFLDSFQKLTLKEKCKLSSQALIDASYICNEYKSKTNKQAIVQIDFLVDLAKNKTAIEEGIKIGEAVGYGMNELKSLGNAPGNVCTPKYLAEQATNLSEQFSSLSVEILKEKEMKELKMGSLLSVSKGSKQKPRLIKLQHKGATGKPIVLIGKGVTFDSGGISLKPGAGMDEMKYDMCGAGSVIGTMKTIAMLKLPINVIGLIPAVENMPSSKASKPGDIVTSMSGKTIEILNTDAEGRLILCDAITYCKKFKPKAVIDIATLTGAVIIALGRNPSGLMANSEPLAKELLKAGEVSLDRAWQLPIWDEYVEQLQSPFADLQNIGGREAGSITAGCFLAEFAKGLKWAHLDIAGTAWNSGKNKGATGRPVPLLVEYLISQV